MTYGSFFKNKEISHVIEVWIRERGFGSSIREVSVNQETISIVKEIGESGVDALFQELEKHAENRKASTFISNLLFEITTKESLPILLNHLESTCLEVKGAAGTNLHKLAWEPENDQQKGMYFIAIGAWDSLVDLGEIATGEIIKVLNYAITNPHSIYPYVTFIETVGEMRLPALENKLIELLSKVEADLNLMPNAIIEALGKIGNRQSIGPILEHLTTAKLLERAKRKTYVNALINIASEHSEAVKEALNDNDKQVKKVAKLVLKKI
jgi:HEAT repeat protein